MTSFPRWTAPLVLLAACTPQHPDALGTLEYDRITVPAPASERIVSLPVHEGQTVQAGTVLMQLDAARAQAQTDASTAEVARQRSALDELQAGPRREEIEQARAQLAAAEAQAREADATYRRLQPLAQRQLVAAIDLDRARAAAHDVDQHHRHFRDIRQTKIFLLQRKTGTGSRRQGFHARDRRTYNGSDSSDFIFHLNETAIEFRQFLRHDLRYFG